MSSFAASLAKEAQSIYAKAEREGRDLTVGERRDVLDLLGRVDDAKSIDAKFSAQPPPELQGLGGGSFMQSGAWAGGGPGDVFVQSSGYKAISSPDSRPQQWSSGLVEVSQSPMLMKGTLLETGAGGPGGGLTPAFYQPGINSKLFEPLGVADVFGSSQTSASQVRYVTEGTATNAAAGVAEGGAKPESTLVYSEVQEPVKKIATWLPISDEFLEDAPSVQSYLNDRLGLFVKLEEERQLLRGAGTNELVGIHNRSGINLYNAGSDDNATAIAKVIANTGGSANLYPDAIILHPNQWISTRLLRDGTGGTAGQFFGGGPFTGAYGNGGAASAGLFGASLWNLPVVLSTHVGAGTALVGNFGLGAHIWRRGGVSVEATNSHSDYFRYNLTAIRAEERLGLGVFRPNAITEVRGLD